MRVGSIIAIYFVIWWTILFAVLPFGNRTHEEGGSAVEPGSASSAPMRPRLLVKAVATSIVAAVLLAIVLWVRDSGLTLEDVPLFRSMP